MNILLENDISEVTLNRGDVLFMEDDNVEFLYLLTSGRATCVKRQNERLIPLYSHEARGILGEEMILSRKAAYEYSAVVLEDNSTFSKIQKNEINDVLNESSGWISALLANLADKVIHTSELISEHQIIDERLNNNCELCDDDLALVRRSLDRDLLSST